MKLVVETNRLLLREWKETDRYEFREMNSDPEVMRYYPGVLDSQESDDLYYRILNTMEKTGYGLWAVETKRDGCFIGYTGFNPATFESEFTPCVEIGWRLRKEAWGKGYATEGAVACLRYAFCDLDLPKVYSFTSLLNRPSERVMQKIGLKKLGEFEHPGVPNGSVLKRHTLYGLSAEEYFASGISPSSEIRPRP